MSARFSGLKANIDKCVLVSLGFDGSVPEYFFDSGFQIDNKVKILGCTVYNETSKLSKNFDETISQLIKTKNFWARFNLSLPGRIAIAKTLMLSKLSYLGCILNPDPDQLLEINNIITSFVKGKINVAHEKIMAPVEIGGLGMINLNDFLKCIKLAWIERAISIDDMWATAVVNTRLDRPDFHSTQNQDAINQPIINNIYTAFCEFRSCTVLYKKNILLSPVVDNPVLIEKGVASIKHDDIPVQLFDRIRNLTFSDLIVKLIDLLLLELE
jgi:hypothetical protein